MSQDVQFGLRFKKIMKKELSEMSWEDAKALHYSREDWITAVNTNTRPRMYKKLLKAAGSLIKTQIMKKDRTTDEQYTQRLAICVACEHAVHKNGSLYTCGPMFQSLIDNNKKTCGCILTKKARDTKQKCPFGYWPTIKQT